MLKPFATSLALLAGLGQAAAATLSLNPVVVPGGIDTQVTAMGADGRSAASASSSAPTPLSASPSSARR